MSRVASFTNLAESQSRERFYSVVHDLLYVGLFVHAILIPVFFTLGVTTLAFTNIVSVALYLGGISIGRRAQTDIAFALGAIEILGHSALAVLNLGWQGGFQYYIFLVAILVFLHPSERTSLKALAAALVYLLFVSLSYQAQVTAPLTPVAAEVLRVFEAFNVSTFFFLIVFLAFLYHKAAGRAEAKLQSANQTLDRLARLDELTGLANRRAMIAALDQAVRDFAVDSRVFSVVICDVDGFKLINDQFGHTLGDEALRRTAEVLRAAVREQDLVARWGGEEFLMLLPATDIAAAEHVAERVRRQILAAEVRVAHASPVLTLTFGVAAHTVGATIEETVASADRALYAGKSTGKNRVVRADSASVTAVPVSSPAD